LVQAFRRILDRAVNGAMVVAEVAIVLMMVHITAELISRWLFRQGLESVPEFVAFFYMTSVAFLSLAYVTRGNGHLAAEFFTERMKPRHREILSGVIAIWLGLFMLLLTWQLTQEAVTMTATREVHQGVTFNLPKWPGRWIMAVGSAIMMAYSFAIGVQRLFGLAGDPPAAAKPASLD
jgi:TRAP-type C4-dicarboxylate transport system permease small subunit